MVDLAGIRFRPGCARTDAADLLHPLVRHRRCAGIAHRLPGTQPAARHAGTALGAVLVGYHAAVVQGVSQEETRHPLDR
ncbi:hypothetical protein D3C72_2102950 [compost metagenome]